MAIFTTPLNDVKTSVAADYTAGSGTIQFTDVTNMGSPSVSAPIRLTIIRLSDGAKTILKITNITGNTATVAGALEGYPDINLATNDLVESRFSAGYITDLYTSFDAGLLRIGNSVVDGTAKNVLFVDPSGNLAQSASLIWDDVTKTFKIKAAIGQSANLVEVQNSTGTILAYIDSAGVVATPKVNFGTQAGTLLAPTPQTLWEHQPRDPQFGPWHCHSGGAFFSGIWDPVLYYGYNTHYATNHNPDEPSFTFNLEANYYEIETDKTTCESYVEFLSADESLRVRPWMFTMDKATGANRFGINIGPADTFGDFRINSQDTILFQLDGGGISPSALDTIAKLSWSSLETFNYTANSLGSTLTLKGVPTKLHLDNGNSIIQWKDQWNLNINNADNQFYVRDMLNSRNHVVYLGAATSASALTTFNSRTLTNAQVSVINGAPLSFAARGRAIGFGPSTQSVDNYTNYISYSSAGTAINCTVNFDLCDGTVSGHVTPLSLRGDNSALFGGAVTITGKVGINETTPGAQLQVNADAAATKGLIIKGFTSQSANLQEWQSSTGTVLSYVTSGGIIRVGAGPFSTDTNAGLEVAYNSSSSIIALGSSAPSLRSICTVNTVITKVQSVSTLGIIGTESNHPVAIYSNNINRINIDANGDISTNGANGLYHFQIGGTPKNTVFTALSPSSLSSGDIVLYGNLPTVTGTVNAFTFTGSASTGMIASLINGSTTSTGKTSLMISTVATGGDPLINWNINSTTNWQAGIDNSDSDKWKLSSDSNGTLETSTVITATTGGLVGIGVSAPVTTLDIRGAALVDSSSRQNLSIYDTTAFAQGVGGGLVFGGMYTAGAIGTFAAIQGIKENATSGNYASALQLMTRVSGGALTTQVHIASDGKVGIGTTSPLSIIDVRKTTTGGTTNIDFVNTENTNTTVGQSIRLRLGPWNGFPGTNFHPYVESLIDTTAAAGLAFGTYNGDGLAAVERIRVAFDGKVGINVTAPGAQLQVNARTAATKGLIVKGFTSQSANLFEAQDSTGTAITIINSAGRLGIGGSPSNNLHIFHANNGNGGVWAEDVAGHRAGLSGSNGTSGLPFIGSVSNHAFGLGANNTEFMRILTTGLVGISETNPGAQLQVNTSAAATKGLIVKGFTSQSANLFEIQNSTGTALTTVSSAGNTTFAAPSGYQLTLEDSSGTGVSILRLKGVSNNWGLRCQGNAGDQFWLFNEITGGMPIVVTPVGNVGIGGTASDGPQLAVRSKDAITPTLRARAAPPISKTISNVALTSNVATITTSTAHGIVNGSTVVITGLTTTVLNGTYTITSVPTTTTFTYSKTNANITSVADSGTATVNQTANLVIVEDGAGTGLITVSSTGYTKIGSGTAIGGTAVGLDVCNHADSTINAVGSGFPSIQAVSTTNSVYAKLQAIGSGGYTYIGAQSNHGTRFVTNNIARIFIDNAGLVGIGGDVVSGTQVQVISNSVTNKGLVIKGFTSQSANLQEWQTSTGTVLANVDSNGSLTLDSPLPVSALKIKNTSNRGSFPSNLLSGVADTMLISGGRDSTNTYWFMDYTMPSGGTFRYVKLDATYGEDANTTLQLVKATDSPGSGWAAIESVYHSGLLLAAYPDRPILFMINRVEWARIASDGKVGINTTTPGAQLQVNSNAAAFKGLIVKGFTSQSANIFEVQNSAGTELFTIASSGSLAIPRTISSSVPVIDIGDSVASPDTPILKLTRPNNIAAATAAKAALFIQDNAANYMIHVQDTSTNPLLTLRGTGNLGVGTATPGSIGSSGSERYLDVIGATTGIIGVGGAPIASQFIGDINFYHTNKTGSDKRVGVLRYTRSGSDDSSQFTLYTMNSGSFSQAIDVDKSGKVGIGSPTPGSQLQITTPGAVIKGVIVKGFTSQSATLFEAQDSTGTALVTIGATGDLATTGNLSTPYKITRSLTRTIPSIVGDAVDIGTFSMSNGASLFQVSITNPSASYSTSKFYNFCVLYNHTNDVWTTVLPFTSSGPYDAGTQDADLEAKVSGGILSLRIRRTLGTITGLCYITIDQQGPVASFTSSTTVNTVAAPTSFFPATQITQMGGKTGINIMEPVGQLHVVPSAANVKGEIIKAGTTLATITNVALTSNVATITTLPFNGLTIGQTIVISGLTNTVLNGTYVVATTPSNSIFTFAKVNADISSVADTGTVTGQQTANLFETQSSAGTALTTIKSDGSIGLVTLDDSVATNSSLYYSSTQSKVVWKDSSGVANPLY